MRTVIHYRWRYFDEIRNKWMTTRYHCEESLIRREHPDAVAVEGSGIERTHYDSYGDALAENSTSRFMAGATDSGSQ